MKKYDSKLLSLNNINFILYPGQDNKKEKIEKENKNINKENKIIINYSQENPYYKCTHIYSMPNDIKYNLIHTSGNYNNDINIQSEKSNKIKIKTFIDDNKKNLYIKKNLNDYCFACKRNYENKKIKNMVQEMFKGQEIETSIKNINIKTFNSPNKVKNNNIINFSSIESNIQEKKIFNNNINSINDIEKVDEKNNEIIINDKNNENKNPEKVEEKNNEINQDNNNEKIEEKNNEKIEDNIKENIEENNNEKIEDKNSEKNEDKINEIIEENNNEKIEEKNSEKNEDKINENIEEKNNEKNEENNNENIENKNHEKRKNRR